jgi:hypothetical protein
METGRHSISQLHQTPREQLVLRKSPFEKSKYSTPTTRRKDKIDPPTTSKYFFTCLASNITPMAKTTRCVAVVPMDKYEPCSDCQKYTRYKNQIETQFAHHFVIFYFL